MCSLFPRISSLQRPSGATPPSSSRVCRLMSSTPSRAQPALPGNLWPGFSASSASRLRSSGHRDPDDSHNSKHRRIEQKVFNESNYSPEPPCRLCGSIVRRALLPCSLRDSNHGWRSWIQIQRMDTTSLCWSAGASTQHCVVFPGVPRLLILVGWWISTITSPDFPAASICAIYPPESLHKSSSRRPHQGGGRRIGAEGTCVLHPHQSPGQACQGSQSSALLFLPCL